MIGARKKEDNEYGSCRNVGGLLGPGNLPGYLHHGGIGVTMFAMFMLIVWCLAFLIVLIGLDEESLGITLFGLLLVLGSTLVLVIH